MDIVILGVDLGKNVCSLVGLDGGGRVIVRRRLRRSSVAEFAQKWLGCVVAIEACCGAHHLGRALVARGHEVRLAVGARTRLPGVSRACPASAR
jgi:transposase